MNRRQLLASMGASMAVSVSGCTAVLGSACRPGNDAIGDIDAERPIENGGETYSVRGTVVRHLLLGLLVDDTTGKVEIRPANLQLEFNRDLISVGDCVEAKARLEAKQTRENGMAVLDVREEDFEVLGGSNADVDSVGDYPSSDFDFDHPSDHAIQFTVVGGDGAKAGNVFFAYGDGADRWTDLDPNVEPTATLERGMSVTIHGVRGKLVVPQWRSADRTWGRRLGSFGGPGL